MSEPRKLVLSARTIAATADILDEAYPGVELWEWCPLRLFDGCGARFVRVLGAQVAEGGSAEGRS